MKVETPPPTPTGITDAEALFAAAVAYDRELADDLRKENAQRQRAETAAVQRLWAKAVKLLAPPKGVVAP